MFTICRMLQKRYRPISLLAMCLGSDTRNRIVSIHRLRRSSLQTKGRTDTHVREVNRLIIWCDCPCLSHSTGFVSPQWFTATWMSSDVNPACSASCKIIPCRLPNSRKLGSTQKSLRKKMNGPAILLRFLSKVIENLY